MLRSVMSMMMLMDMMLRYRCLGEFHYAPHYYDDHDAEHFSFVYFAICVFYNVRNNDDDNANEFSSSC